MAVVAESISERLRQEVRVPHQRALHARFQRALRNGTLPREAYLDWLAQRCLLHQAVADEAAELAEPQSVFGCTVRHQRGLLAALRADLLFFDLAPDTIRPSGVGERLIASIGGTARLNPITLLGVCYVLHVTGGGTPFRLQRLRAAYGLEPGPGTQYLDAGCRYQRAGVCAVGRADDAGGVSRVQIHALVAAARMTYVLLGQLEEGLLRRATCAAASAAGDRAVQRRGTLRSVGPAARLTGRYGVQPQSPRRIPRSD